MLKTIILSVILTVFIATAFAESNTVTISKKNIHNTQNCDVNGWCDVPLDNKEPFDLNCEYRAKVNIQYNFQSWAISEIYAAKVRKGALLFSYYDNYLNDYGTDTMSSSDKSHIDNVGVTLSTISLQERCKYPDIIPQGMIGVFNLTTCPIGWKPFTNSENYPHPQGTVVCKYSGSISLILPQIN